MKNGSIERKEQRDNRVVPMEEEWWIWRNFIASSISFEEIQTPAISNASSTLKKRYQGKTRKSKGERGGWVGGKEGRTEEGGEVKEGKGGDLSKSSL